MAIWTKAQFRTDSHKYFSKRNGTIAEIDTALGEYHKPTNTPVKRDADLDALLTVILKFETEKKLKHAAAPGKQSKARKDSVARLKVQVEAALWQRHYDRKIQDRDDLSAFFRRKRKKEDHDDVLMDWLIKLKMQVKQGDPATNQLKKDLHARIDAYFDPNGAKLWLPAVQSGVYPWASASQNQFPYIAPTGHLGSQVRVATVDLESVLGGGAMDYVRWGTGDNLDWMTALEKGAVFSKVLEAKDHGNSWLQSVNQVAEYFPGDLRTLMENYLRSLLTVDLKEQSQLAMRALKSDPDGYRAVVHIDYYATRDTDTVGLHKDTTGNTLFAVLHYINDDAMLGPEYIDDPKPIESVNPGYYKDDRWSLIGDEYKRSGAPWAKVGKGAFVWPQDLLEALNRARKNPDSDVAQGKVHDSVLPKDGLVSFVDELIFHATPLAGHRADKPATDVVRYYSAGVTLAPLLKGNAANTVPLNLFGAKTKADRIQRRLSAHYANGVHLETGLAIPGAKSGGVRKFFRLWICITPKHWYTSLPAYP